MKLPNIPFINPKKEQTSQPVKRRAINVSPDEARIQREMNYESRIGRRDSRLKRLQDRVNNQKRRSYGK